MQQADIESLTDKAWTLVEAGRFREAYALFARVCEISPHDPEAWMMRGVTQMELGGSVDARSYLDRAVELDASYADPYLHLGKLALATGDASQAFELAEKTIALDPQFAEAWMLCGAAQGALGRHTEAETSTRKALSLNPALIPAEVQLAHALAAQGRLDEAAQCLHQILDRIPGLAEVELDLAGIYARLARYGEAAACYRTYLVRHPGDARAHNELGNAYMALDDHINAERSYRQAVELSNPEAYANLGLILQARGDFSGAATLCEKALSIRPDSAPLHQMLATVLEFLGRYDEAIACCDRAMAIDPGFSEAVGTKGRILIKRGEYRLCHEMLHPLIESGRASAKGKLVFAEAATRLGLEGDTAVVLEKALSEDVLAKTERQQIHAALGRIYDETKRFDQAFVHFKQSNALKAGSFDLPKHIHFVDSLIATFNPGFLQSAPRSQCSSGLPVFVVGMPRSGTSLVEQILSSHPDVFGAGELGDIQLIARTLAEHHAPLGYPQCVNHVSAEELTQSALGYVRHLHSLNGGASCVVDKMPHNFMHLGLIQLLFPHARVVHVRRDPLDTCLSCYTQEFTAAHAYTYDLGVLGGYYGQYERLMRHWQSVLQIPILNVQYETLVADQETASRQLLDFCGLEWDDRVLRFYELKRDVATASFDQVRQPLYKKSVQRWKNYERYLAPLVAALGR